MRQKIEDWIEIKTTTLLAVEKLIASENNKGVLKDLLKNEIELKAQIAILTHIISTK